MCICNSNVLNIFTGGWGLAVWPPRRPRSCIYIYIYIYIHVHMYVSIGFAYT